MIRVGYKEDFSDQEDVTVVVGSVAINAGSVKMYGVKLQ